MGQTIELVAGCPIRYHPPSIRSTATYSSNKVFKVFSVWEVRDVRDADTDGKKFAGKTGNPNCLPAGDDGLTWMYLQDNLETLWLKLHGPITESLNWSHWVHYITIRCALNFGINSY